MKTNHKDLEFNGYKCYYFEKGIYSFQKQVGKNYSGIECTEEQLTNGDIEFMTTHGWTISNERKVRYQLRYKPTPIEKQPYPQRYNYAMLVENTPDRYLHQESTLLPSKFKKTKYAVIERQMFDDGSECYNRIVYLNNIEKATELLEKYSSWYNYLTMMVKSSQGYITPLP